MRALRQAFHYLIVHSMNVDQVNQIGQHLDNRFNAHKISGFGDIIPVPRQVAADAAVEYFTDEKDIVSFISLILQNEGKFMHQSRMYARGKERVLAILERRDWVYDPEHKTFFKDQKATTTNDWGFMREGEEYKLAFASIDIVGNSELVRNNVRDDLESTYNRLRQFIHRQVESRNGRIWFWHGDGGLATFYDHRGIRQAVNSMVALLTYLPVFNIFQNELKPEDEIRLRLGLSFGRATYTSDLSKVISEDLKLAENLEKNGALPNTMAVTENIYTSLDHRLQQLFDARTGDSLGTYYLYRRGASR